MVNRGQIVNMSKVSFTSSSCGVHDEDRINIYYSQSLISIHLHFFSSFPEQLPELNVSQHPLCSIKSQLRSNYSKAMFPFRERGVPLLLRLCLCVN